MDYFGILPVEITLEILSRVVPTESVLGCKLVCTSWRNLISHHSSFSKMHLHHLNANNSGKLGFVALTFDIYGFRFQYFEYDDENHESAIIPGFITSPLKFPSFIGSCHGLICLADKKSLCICNPVTKEFVMLPELKNDFCDIDGSRNCDAIGFGYVSSTNNYKVVRISYVPKTNEQVRVYIYTLGSRNGWRNLGKLNSQFYSLNGVGIFVNGALYWVDDVLKMIVIFDLAEEKFCKHLSPPLSLGPDWHYRTLGVVDGFLYFANFGITKCYNIWLLRKKNDNHDMKERDERQSLCWSKEFRVAGNIFAITKSDCALTYSGSHVISYHMKTSTKKTLLEFGSNSILQLFPHKNTLVSLKELGEEVTKINGVS